mgnify:CR=1 FL=1
MEYDRYYIYGVILSDRAVAGNEHTRFAPGLGNLYCNYLVSILSIDIERTRPPHEKISNGFHGVVGENSELSIFWVVREYFRAILYNGDRSERK